MTPHQRRSFPRPRRAQSATTGFYSMSKVSKLPTIFTCFKVFSFFFFFFLLGKGGTLLSSFPAGLRVHDIICCCCIHLILFHPLSSTSPYLSAAVANKGTQDGVVSNHSWWLARDRGRVPRLRYPMPAWPPQDTLSIGPIRRRSPSPSRSRCAFPGLGLRS